MPPPKDDPNRDKLKEEIKEANVMYEKRATSQPSKTERIQNFFQKK